MAELLPPDRADWTARCYVNGTRLHGKSGKMEPDCDQFSKHFINHPWVRQSAVEGWDRDLRAHLVHVIKLRLMRGEGYGSIEQVMPDAKWVEEAKFAAARYKAAANWQKENRSNTGMAALLVAIARNADLDYNPATGELE